MKLVKIIFTITMCTFLTGCWDKVELEDRGLVLSLGIDKYSGNITEENAEPLIYTVSMDIPNISDNNKESQENQGNQESQENQEISDSSETQTKDSIKSSTGQTIYSAMKLVDSYTSQRLYYGHTKAVIFGSEILENENYLKEVIDALERNQEISRKLIVLSTKGKAKDILNFIPEEKGAGIFINDFYKNNMDNTSFTFRQDLESIIQDLLSTGDTVIPEIEIENNSVKISGLAVIKDYKLIGWLDENMTKSFLWFNKTKNIGGEVSVVFEEGFVPLKITNNKVKITLEQEDDIIITNIDIDIEGNIGEYMLSQSIMMDTDKYKILQQEYVNKIKKEVLEFIYILQNDLKADIIGLKEICRKNYNNIYKNFNLEENNIYNNVLFNVNVEVKIRGSGNIK